MEEEYKVSYNNRNLQVKFAGCDCLIYFKNSTTVDRRINYGIVCIA